MTTTTPEMTIAPSFETAASQRTGFPIEIVILGLSVLTVLALAIAPHQVGVF